MNKHTDNWEQSRSNSKKRCKVVEAYNYGKKEHKQTYCRSLIKDIEDTGKGRKKVEDSYESGAM